MRVWILCFVFFLSGCSTSFYSDSTSMRQEVVHYETLQNIDVSRWGETRFSGILALSQAESGMHYALIDGTGVKLLQAFSDRNGRHDRVVPKGPLAKERLAGFLSEAIARIYLFEPMGKNCTRKMFASLCMQELDDTKREKTARFLGIRLWTVETVVPKHVDNGASREPYVRYSQPWLGVTIMLRAMATKEYGIR